MIILQNTSTTLVAVTSTTNKIIYTVEWDDLTSTTTTLARGSNSASITTATTTTLTGSPASMTERSIKQIIVKNVGTTSGGVLLQKFDGTNYWDLSANVSLQPNYSYVYVEARGFRQYDNNGIEVSSSYGEANLAYAAANVAYSQTVFANLLANTISSNQNNYAPLGQTANTNIISFNPIGNVSIGGLSNTNVTLGLPILLYNSSTSNTITFLNKSGGSTTGNQLSCPGAATATLGPQFSVKAILINTSPIPTWIFG